MPQKMEAELIFDHPAGRDLAVAVLKKQGYEVEILDWVDEYEGAILTPTVWIKVRGSYEAATTSSSTRWGLGQAVQRRRG